VKKGETRFHRKKLRGGQVLNKKNRARLKKGENSNKRASASVTLVTPHRNDGGGTVVWEKKPNARCTVEEGGRQKKGGKTWKTAGNEFGVLGASFLGGKKEKDFPPVTTIVHLKEKVGKMG